MGTPHRDEPRAQDTFATQAGTYDNFILQNREFISRQSCSRMVILICLVCVYGKYVQGFVSELFVIMVSLSEEITFFFCKYTVAYRIS